MDRTWFGRASTKPHINGHQEFLKTVFRLPAVREPLARDCPLAYLFLSRGRATTKEERSACWPRVCLVEINNQYVHFNASVSHYFSLFLTVFCQRFLCKNHAECSFRLVDRHREPHDREERVCF